MSAARSKGTLAERWVVEYLRENGFPHAERAPLTGALGRGDITGTPGLSWEVKNASRLALPEWLRQAEQERVNTNSDYGILVTKPKGMGVSQIEWWPASLPFGRMVPLLVSLGYGSLEGVR